MFIQWTRVNAIANTAIIINAKRTPFFMNTNPLAQSIER